LERKIQSAYQEELQMLDATSREIDKQLQELRSIPAYYGPDLTEQVLESIRESSRRNLAKAADEPYFGRLDFQEQGQETPSPLYIGKVGVENPDTGRPLVIDWRAPAASLFYSFTGGTKPASYDSPEGLIEGLVYLKRNIVIRKQILQRVVDTYDRAGDTPAVTDEFLLYRLGENKDNKLRDIVSTIQAEQDRIIRSAKNTALIIQGVAGSGKTTVALHRLAFLLYQYRENIRADKMIIFAPNLMFLDYISGVLPELGVGTIQQNTFTDWALDLLEHEVKLTDPAARLEQWFSIGPERPEMNDRVPGRLKGSVAFMRLIQDCLERYERGAVPSSSFQPWDGAKLPAQTIHDWFHVENKHYPLMKRRERVVARIKRWLEMELEKVREAHLRKELKKKASQKLRSYLTGWPELTPFAFYKQLFDEANRPPYLPREMLQAIPEDIAKASCKLFKKKEVHPEDLAPLLYIRDAFHGIQNEHVFDHIVIDEAQDFSPFQVALLKRHVRNSSFTILGDLSQGIHAYQGIVDWSEFSGLFDREQTGYFELDRSYRSTMEIIRFANHILSRGVGTNNLAVPVFRSGEKIELTAVPKPERIAAVLDAVRRIREGNVNTVAIIARTEKECLPIHEALAKSGIAATLIQANQREFGGGVSVLPVYLAKGLEFDAVVLVDADAAHYERTMQDAKLLYVGCTRALHTLTVIYSGELSPLLHGIPEELVG
jgi:DNA helicase-2/ATP-dependent DNA helicase PcrA